MFRDTGPSDVDTYLKEEGGTRVGDEVDRGGRRLDRRSG